MSATSRETQLKLEKYWNLSQYWVKFEPQADFKGLRYIYCLKNVVVLANFEFAHFKKKVEKNTRRTKKKNWVLKWCCFGDVVMWYSKQDYNSKWSVLKLMCCPWHMYLKS